MNLSSLAQLSQLSINAGGPGSGCHGPNCGRPKGSRGVEVTRPFHTVLNKAGFHFVSVDLDKNKALYESNSGKEHIIFNIVMKQGKPFVYGGRGKFVYTDANGNRVLGHGHLELEKAISQRKAKPEVVDQAVSPQKTGLSSREQKLASSPVTGNKEMGGGISETRLITLGDGTKAIFKPASGEPKRWNGTDLMQVRVNITPGKATEREAAAWEVAKLVGMDDLVATTVIRTVGKERGAVMEFQPGDVASNHWMDKKYDGQKNAERAGVFDWVIGNTDRHDGNWLVDNNNNLHLIDHGLAFPENNIDADTSYILGHLMGNDKGTPKDYADRYIQAKPAIAGALKQLGLPDSAIRSVGDRIDKLSKATTWRDLT